MILFDSLIQQIDVLLDNFSGKQILQKSKECLWPDVGENNLILKSEMCYELGGMDQYAVSCLAYTSSENISNQDEIWLYGSDISQIKQDIPYAKIAIIKLAEDFSGETDEEYRILRAMEYMKYHVNPKGYMSRISVAKNREPVRISKAAVDEGLDFEKVGQLYIDAYHKIKEVQSVKLLFITLPEFPYEIVEEYSQTMEQILDSINHIFKEFSMDCKTCGFKKICDEVDGMKEFHLKHQNNK